MVFFPNGNKILHPAIIIPNGILPTSLLEDETKGPAMDFVLPPKPRNVDGKLRDAQDLGEIIRKRRKSIGLTQGELAAACHCSVRFISELERGEAGGNIKQVIRVCKEIGIDLFAKVRGE